MNKRIILSAILTLALLPMMLRAQNPITLLSVRPDADSLEGFNHTFPRVVLCNTGRDSMKNIGLEVLVVDKYDTVVAHLRDTIAAIPGGDTADFSTDRASGSTSQAANIMEAVEKTVEWSKIYVAGGDVLDITEAEIKEYFD